MDSLLFTRMPMAHSEKLHKMWKSLGWTQAKLHRESGVDSSRVAYFCNQKRATARVGARLAIAIIGGLIEIGGK